MSTLQPSLAAATSAPVATGTPPPVVDPLATLAQQVSQANAGGGGAGGGGLDLSGLPSQTAVAPLQATGGGSPLLLVILLVGAIGLLYYWYRHKRT